MFNLTEYPMSESFAEMFEASLKAGQSMQSGTIVNALVLDVKSDVVIVDAGLKSEGVIPLDEFKVDGEVKVAVGEMVEVALETLEDGFGETKFSKEKAERIKAWVRLDNAFEKKETVIGIITGKVKGGFTVDIGAIRAFLPGSLVDVRPVRDTTFLEGKPLEVLARSDRKGKPIRILLPQREHLREADAPRAHRERIDIA